LSGGGREWKNRRGYRADSWRSGKRGRCLVYEGGRICDEKLETSPGITLFATKFIQLVILKCVSKGIGTDLCTVYRVLILLLVGDAQLNARRKLSEAKEDKE